LLRAVQLAGKSPSREIIRLVFGHDSSKCLKLAGVICPVSGYGGLQHQYQQNDYALTERFQRS
jgi:hypothetical protein